MAFFSPKAPRPESVPVPLPDDEREVRETLGFTKGAISLDVVFDTSGTPYVVEIQSIDSGVKGITQDLASDPRVSDEVKQFAKSFAKKRSGHKNPEWFDYVSNNKQDQLAFIPEANRPRSVVNGDIESLFAYGKVIIKPLNESQGNGIKIFDSSQLEAAKSYASSLRKNRGGYIAQQLIASKGAELAPDELKGHAASLRLIIPFEMVNGKVVISMHGVGYQRVAPVPMKDDQSSYDKAGVVNRARDSVSVPMADAEYSKVLPVAVAILENLTKRSEMSATYRRYFVPELNRITNSVWVDLRETLPSKWYVFMVNDDSFSMEEARNMNRLIRYVEREFNAVSAEVREKLVKRNAHISVQARADGRHSIKFSMRAGIGYIDTVVPFTTDDQPGTLVELMEQLSKGKTPKKTEQERVKKATASPLILPMDRARV